jgi:hypothetical protein
VKLILRSNGGLPYVSDVSEELRGQAELLLPQIASSAAELLPGQQTRVRVDWGIVRLVRRGDELVVEEPDYLVQPLRFIAGLNVTCAVLRAQQEVLERLQVSSRPVQYDQFMLVYAAGLTAARIAAIRQDPQQPGDSGWRVFEASDIDWSVQPKAVRIYDIPSSRPSLMAALALPTGWAVRLRQGTLVEAVAPENRHIALDMSFEYLCGDTHSGGTDHESRA